MKNQIILIVLLSIFGSVLYGQDMLLLKSSGQVVIGDTSVISTPPGYSLYLQNGLLTEKVKVALKNSAEWSDDAFERTPTLYDMEQSIQNNSHLLHMPSAEQLVEEGYELKEMDAKILEQVEWLWQHMIELKKENEELRKIITEMENE